MDLKDLLPLLPFAHPSLMLVLFALMVRMPLEALPHALFALLVVRVMELSLLPASVTPPLAKLALLVLYPPLELLIAPHALKARSPTLVLLLATLVLPVTKVSMAMLFVLRVLLLALDVPRATTAPLAVPVARRVLLVSKVLMVSISILVLLFLLAKPALMARTAVPAMLPALCALLDLKDPELPLLNELMSMMLVMFVLVEPAALLVMLIAPLVRKDTILLETLALALVAPQAKKVLMELLLEIPLPTAATPVRQDTILLTLAKLTATLALRATTALLVLRFALIVALANKVSIT